MTTDASLKPKPAPRWRIAVVTWLAIYPSITLLLGAFGALGLLDLPLPLRTLILTAVLVPLMVFVLVPALTRALAGWLCRP